MRILLTFGVFVLVSVVFGLVHVEAEDLKPGDSAPSFELPGTDGNTYSLNELRGRTVVLAWFPKAFTGG